LFEERPSPLVGEVAEGRWGGLMREAIRVAKNTVIVVATLVVIAPVALLVTLLLLSVTEPAPFLPIDGAQPPR
jgi:hypothetical protein